MSTLSSTREWLSTDTPALSPAATMPGAPPAMATTADSAPRARSMDEVLTSLSTRLQRDGGSVDDWLLLGRGYGQHRHGLVQTPSGLQISQMRCQGWACPVLP